ncbi:hypothetical protein, partial [Mediterraneibacter agrestimuris]|uniref:hypothetical protein n=1 Tax=Mediterraneibacter agrestimuris TaxID=2941333 RepID=UPI00203AAFD0
SSLKLTSGIPFPDRLCFMSFVHPSGLPAFCPEKYDLLDIPALMLIYSDYRNTQAHHSLGIPIYSYSINL